MLSSPSLRTNLSMVTVKTHQDRPLFGLAMRFLALALLSVMFMLVKHVEQQGVHVVEAIFYRYFIGALLLTGYMWFQGSLKELKTERLGMHSFRAAIGILAMSCNFAAVTLLPLAEASVLMFTVPLLSTILSVILLREFVGIRRWAAILIGFVGILIALQPGQTSFAWLGVLVGLAGAFFSACVTIAVRHLSKTEPTATIVWLYSVLGIPIMVIPMYFFAQMHAPMTFGLLILASVFGILGMTLLSGSARYATIAVMVPVDYTMLLFASSWGYLIFNDLPAETVWWGMPLIAGSGIYIALREQRLAKGRRVMTSSSLNPD